MAANSRVVPPVIGVEQVPIDDLRPDPANPRRISDEELDALERSLRQFGFVQPVLARREDQTVVGGQGLERRVKGSPPRVPQRSIAIATT